MTARDDYPEMAQIERGIGCSVLEDAEAQISAALDELDRLRDLLCVEVNGGEFEPIHSVYRPGGVLLVLDEIRRLREENAAFRAHFVEVAEIEAAFADWDGNPDHAPAGWVHTPAPKPKRSLRNEIARALIEEHPSGWHQIRFCLDEAEAAVEALRNFVLVFGPTALVGAL